MDRMPVDKTSNPIKQLIDTARNFLNSIIKTNASEFGLLEEDEIKSQRATNMVNILLQTKEIIEEKEIEISPIPLKVLVPLLEKGSLEEEEEFQNLWSKMLANMLNSEQNFQNHVYPYILSQISIEDYHQLKDVLEEELNLRKLQKELLEIQKKDMTNENGTISKYHFSPSQEYREFKNKVRAKEQYGITVYTPESDNLVRLGLIRQLPPRIIIEEFSTGEDDGKQWHNIEAEYEMDDFGFRITELGENFLNVCGE